MSWSRGNWFRCLSGVVVYLLFFDTLASSTLRYVSSRARPVDDFAVSAAQEPVQGAPPQTLHVSASDPSCGGSAPCFRTIQAAIDAVGPGGRVLIHPGQYPEQLRISGKNRRASESDRIVIEADPSAPWGSVVVGPLPGARCPKGASVDIKGSSFVTLRGLVLRNAGRQGVVLRGQGPANQAIHLERNRIYADGDSRCSRGISISHGNKETLVANNLIDGTDREAIYVTDNREGVHTIVSNTLYANRLGGILLARRNRAIVVNNLIVANGEDRSGRRGGIQRRGRTPGPEGVILRGNLVCGNLPQELEGVLLDAGDSGNATPTGSEGPGVAASAGCDDLENVFAGVLGEERAAANEAADFRLAEDSPAIDRGVALVEALSNVAPALLRADLMRATVRPLDGDGDGEADYDVGAIEEGEGGEPTPRPSTSPSSSPGPSPTPSPSPGPAITESPTPTPTPFVGPTASPSPSPTPSATPGPTPVSNGAPGAGDDEYSVRQVDTLEVGAPGVLENDGDPDGDPLTAELIDPPLLGTLTAFNDDGSFSYEPPPDFVQPSLNPGALWRKVSETSGFGQVADFNRDGFPDLAFINFGQILGHDGRNGNRMFEVDFTDTSHVDIRGCTIGGAGTSSMAVGAVDDSGDVAIVKPLACDGGFHNRFVAFNASDITAGKIGPLWRTANLSIPHPDAYASASDPAPANPPIRTQLDVVERTHPSLARLTPTGGVKVLARKLIRNLSGQYLGLLPNGTLGIKFAGCRGATGNPADESQGCRLTWIIDAATGAVEHVLRSPNPDNSLNLPVDRPLSNNPPLTADLDGDGDIEIISGSDVFTQVNGVWTLLWQTTFEPLSVAVADLDGDGTTEVIHFQPNLFGRTPPDSGIFIYRHDGTLVRRIPPVIDSGLLVGFLSVGDVDDDGAPEILFPTAGFLHVFRADGRLLWIFAVPDRPVQVGVFLPPAVSVPFRTGETSAQVYDLDLDGRPEVIMNAGSRLYIFDGATGAEEWSIDTEGGSGARTLALADMDQDGHVDIVASGHNKWNCSTFFGGPVPCLGNITVVSGLDHNWAPGPKVFNQLTFNPDQVDDDAKILFSAAPRRDYRMPEQQGTVVDPRLREGTQFTYTAKDASASSNPATVFLEIRPNNSPPTITSLPPTGMRSITPYARPVYQITATDPDPGDVLHYEFVSTTHFLGGKTETTVGGGTGVSVNPDTGAVSFYIGPCGSFGGGCNLGDVIVVVAAVDALGLRDEQSFLVTIHANATNVPNVVGQLLEAAIDAIQAASLRARVILELFDSEPAGTVLGQNPPGGTTNVALGTSVDLTLSKGPEPTPTPAPTATPDPNATPSPDIESIVVEPDGQILRVGDTQQYKATAVFADGTSFDVTASASWGSSEETTATIAAGGLATAVGAGTTTITAMTGGKSGNASLTVLTRVPSDFTDPTAETSSPADGDEITAPIDVVGTATDPNFLRYELAIAPAGEDDFTILQTGAAPVTNGVLGRLDPTLLLNDLYDVRLTVIDRGGNESSAVVTVQVAGDLKVGLFSIGFRDLAVPLSGIPIIVHRTYDSRDKSKGDFGIGWQLGVQTLQVRANREQGTGWVVDRFGGGAGTYVLSPVGEHKVSLALADGKLEVFDMVVTPSVSPLLPLQTAAVSYAPRPGTFGTLAVLENTDILVIGNQPGEVELVDDGTLNAFHPKRFRYTSPNGGSIDIDRTKGVEMVRDPNGNTLTFTPGGITHSSGQAITFTRDAQDRITQLTDPSGEIQTYAYDANGDLVAHTDPLGNLTRFRYNRSHGLLEVMDPLGNRAVRNEYDEAGRLVAQTDARGNRTTYDHDVDGRQEIVTDRLGRASLIEYDDAGNVLSRTNPEGETTSFTYDARGNTLTMTDPLGHETMYAYDDRDNLKSSTDPLGHTTTFSYNGRDQILTITDPLGHTRSSAYDASGKLDSRTDEEGHTTSFTYDAAGNQLSSTDPLLQVTRIEYNAAGQRTKLIDALGDETSLTNDQSGRLRTQTQTGGASWSLGYDATGRPTSLTLDGIGGTAGYDATGKITEMSSAGGSPGRFSYDATGALTEFVGPDGTSAFKRGYDAERNLVSQTDRMGNIVRHEYDGADRLVATTSADGAVRSWSYDAAGRVASTTDPLGRTTSYGYDSAGRNTTVTDAMGEVTTMEYDDGDRLVAVTDPLGQTTQYEYDAGDHLVKTTFADGTIEELVYDANGQLLERIDPRGNATTFAYDALGRVSQVTDPLGHATQYEYDDAGQKTAIIDANGNRTTFTYDTQGRLLSTTTPDGDVESSTYDVDGRVATRTNGNGETLGYTYNPRGFPTQLTLPGGGVETHTYTPDGFVSTVTDARGTTQLEYVPTTRRLLRATEPDGRYVRYEYDLAGNRTLMAHAMSAAGPEDVTRYDYDDLNRLTEVTDPDGGVTKHFYDAASNLIRVEHPNGTVALSTYDELNRLRSVRHEDAGGGMLAALVYTLDAAGNRTVEERGDGSRTEYDYDDVGRVVAERSFNMVGTLQAETTYAYDDVGNLTSRSGALGNATYAYNDDNQLLSGDGFTYTYDGAGNRTSAIEDVGGDTTTFAYDARGRMVGFTPSTGGPTTYEYDWSGLRQSKSGPSGVIHFLSDRQNATGFAQVVRESDASGATLRSYTYGARLLAQKDEAGEVRQHHADGVGSTRLLTDQAGATTDTYGYSAYGLPLVRTGTSPNVYQFAGEQRDDESGLYYLRARYYDPAIGRFIARDPAPGNEDDPLSLHKYQYAHDNPVNVTDPSGRESVLSLMQAVQLRALQLSQRLVNYKKAVDKSVEMVGESAEQLMILLTAYALIKAEENPYLSLYFFGLPPFQKGGEWLTMFMVGDALYRDTEYDFRWDCGKEDAFACVNRVREVAKDQIPKYSPPVPSNIAYIYLTPKFRELLPLPNGKGKQSMPGVILHEYTHISMRVGDPKRGCKRSFIRKALTKTFGAALENPLPGLSELEFLLSLGSASVELRTPDTYACFMEFSYRGFFPEN